MKRAELPFGPGKLTLELPEGLKARRIEPAHSVALEDPAGALEKALAAPLNSPPLSEMARGRKNAVIVVSDATRPVPNGLILPPLLKALEAGGIAPEGITLLIATGLHEVPGEEEMRRIAGCELPPGVRLLAHDSRDPAALAEVGRFEGHPVELNRGYLDAELKILTGMIEPHALAGFSGGAKSLVPGLCGLETLKLVHSYRLVERIGDSTGRVEGNPLRGLIDEIAARAGADFCVNVLLDRARRVTGIFAGALGAVFGAGCRAATQEQLVPVDRLAETVLTTGGGEPLDRTFYQGCKGLITGAKFLAPGGTLAFAMECADGLGSPGFREAVKRSGSREGFCRIYNNPANFTVDQWALQALFSALGKAGRVVGYAPGLKTEDAACLGIELVESPEALSALLGNRGGEVFILSDGPYVSAKAGGS